MKKKLLLILVTFVISACTIVQIVQNNKRVPSNVSAPIVNVLNPAILSQIENSGFSLSQVLNGTTRYKTTEQLFNNNGIYASIVKTIGKKIRNSIELNNTS